MAHVQPEFLNDGEGGRVRFFGDFVPGVVRILRGSFGKWSERQEAEPKEKKGRKGPGEYSRGPAQVKEGPQESGYG